MQYHYPTPGEAGVDIPTEVRQQLFKAGFRHGLEGGKVERIEHMRYSFRMGLRAAKLYLRRVRRSQGIIEFPGRLKFRVKVTDKPPAPLSQKRKS